MPLTCNPEQPLAKKVIEINARKIRRPEPRILLRFTPRPRPRRHGNRHKKVAGAGRLLTATVEPAPRGSPDEELHGRWSIRGELDLRRTEGAGCGIWQPKATELQGIGEARDRIQRDTHGDVLLALKREGGRTYLEGELGRGASRDGRGG